MKVEVYQSEPGQYNLDNYAKAYQNSIGRKLKSHFLGMKLEK